MEQGKSYRELLLDPRWQRRRLEVLNRAKWTCEKCRATDRTLHVHHRIYHRNHAPWEYTDAELQVLCWVCHEEMGDWRQRIDVALCRLDWLYFESVAYYIEDLVSRQL